MSTNSQSPLRKLWRVLSRCFVHPSCLVSVSCLAACAPVWAPPKQDILTMTNGDRITCEIIRLDRGISL